MPTHPSNTWRVAVLLAVVATVAVGSCLLVFYGFIRPQLPVAYEHETFVEQLDLNAAQRAAVEDIDRRFEAERGRILEHFNAATRDLAALLAREDAFTGDVAAAINRVHGYHGELQALSVRRYFAVLDVLPDEKRPAFRRLAAEALSQPE